MIIIQNPVMISLKYSLGIKENILNLIKTRKIHKRQRLKRNEWGYEGKKNKKE